MTMRQRGAVQVIHQRGYCWSAHKSCFSRIINRLIFIDELLSTFQSAKFAFCSFQESLKTPKDYAKQASLRSDRDLMSVRLTPYFIDVQNSRGNCMPVCQYFTKKMY